MIFETKCPKCDGKITLTDPEQCEILECEECKASLEVREVTPTIKLEDAPPVQEDWGE